MGLGSVAKSEYHYGGSWRPNTKKFAGGGPKNPSPWTEEHAERKFNGEVRARPGGFYQLGVLKGPLDAPEAVATFQDEGHTVKVEFFDNEFRPVLTYLFVDKDLPDGMFLNPQGIQRPGDLLMRAVTRTEWTGEPGPHGMEKKHVTVRQHSNLGTTRVGPLHIEPEDRVPENDWHTDPEIDVSGDGFWEPVATFGDWDRWFVRDRPGVKLFD